MTPEAGERAGLVVRREHDGAGVACRLPPRRLRCRCACRRCRAHPTSRRDIATLTSLSWSRGPRASPVDAYRENARRPDRRSSAADNCHAATAARHGFTWSCAVVDARAEELVDSVDVEATPVDAARGRTDRMRTSVPSESRARYPSSSCAMSTSCRAKTSSAPKRRTCAVARVANSLPLMPCGKPR